MSMIPLSVTGQNGVDFEVSVNASPNSFCVNQIKNSFKLRSNGEVVSHSPSPTAALIEGQKGKVI